MQKTEFNPDLKLGVEISNDEICALFKCSPQGGMRRSLETKTLVLVSNLKGREYNDHWEGDILHYTGQGLTGNQDLNFGQNKTLLNHKKERVSVFLFEKLAKNQYIYHGQVELCQEPYQQKQTDVEDKVRIVWVFPVKSVYGESVPVSAKAILQRREEKEEIAKTISDERLSEKLANEKENNPSGKPSSRSTTTTVFDRSPYVVEHCNRRANGICELCSKPAPFNKKKTGAPFLECHHIKWLSKGGTDTTDNAVALCPNCHRKMHSLNLKSDQEKLLEKAKG